MPTGSSAITLATTAKLEQESFEEEPCRMETWTVITKGQVILKKTQYQKLATLSTPPHRRCVHKLCTKAQLCWQMTLGGFFFFLSEIKGVLPIGLAFPAEGSADVAMLCFSQHHLCTTFAMSTVPETSLKQVQPAVAQRKDYSRVLYHRKLPPGLSPENKNVLQTI